MRPETIRARRETAVNPLGVLDALAQAQLVSGIHVVVAFILTKVRRGEPPRSNMRCTCPTNTYPCQKTAQREALDEGNKVQWSPYRVLGSSVDCPDLARSRTNCRTPRRREPLPPPGRACCACCCRAAEPPAPASLELPAAAPTADWSAPSAPARVHTTCMPQRSVQDRAAVIRTGWELVGSRSAEAEPNRRATASTQRVCWLAQHRACLMPAAY